MLELFDKVFGWIEVLFDCIVMVIDGLIRLIGIIPMFLEFVVTSVGLLPSICISFVIAATATSVFLWVAGRKS